MSQFRPLHITYGEDTIRQADFVGSYGNENIDGSGGDFDQDFTGGGSLFVDSDHSGVTLYGNDISGSATVIDYSSSRASRQSRSFVLHHHGVFS